MRFAVESSNSTNAASSSSPAVSSNSERKGPKLGSVAIMSAMVWFVLSTTRQGLLGLLGLLVCEIDPHFGRSLRALGRFRLGYDTFFRTVFYCTVSSVSSLYVSSVYSGSSVYSIARSIRTLVAVCANSDVFRLGYDTFFRTVFYCTVSRVETSHKRKVQSNRRINCDACVKIQKIENTAAASSTRRSCGEAAGKSQRKSSANNQSHRRFVVSGWRAQKPKTLLGRFCLEIFIRAALQTRCFDFHTSQFARNDCEHKSLDTAITDALLYRIVLEALPTVLDGTSSQLAMKTQHLHLLVVVLLLLPQAANAQFEFLVDIFNALIGFFCLLPILNLFCNDCDPDPCSGNGVCTDQVGGFTCTCNDGFAGDTCDDEVESCGLLMDWDVECILAGNGPQAGLDCESPLLGYVECLDRPTAATMLFTGGGCEQGDNTQSSPNILAPTTIPVVHHRLKALNPTLS